MYLVHRNSLAVTDGLMGKLRIRRSGKMELVLGVNTFTVTPGSSTNFAQEVKTVCSEKGKESYVSLGNIDGRFVVAPSVEQVSCNDRSSQIILIISQQLLGDLKIKKAK